METQVGLSRALGAVLKHKAHLINMSYGEPTATPNAGRFIELASEVDALPHSAAHFVHAADVQWEMESCSMLAWNPAGPY